MKLAVLKERAEGEFRVAASPESVKRLSELGFSVHIEKGAGEGSDIADKDYKEAGAKIEKDAGATLQDAEVLLAVQPPFNGGQPLEGLSSMKKGAAIASLMNPHENRNAIERFGAEQRATLFGLELLPRITRAQGMDVLSSQSNLAGYKAVIGAVAQLNKVVPMMMTAAGTVKPAHIFIMGAGVAGLQAIATAKRLGAVVTAIDVRPVVKEQVESLGATFVETPMPAEDAETSGGYAKEMSKEYLQKQQEVVAEHVKSQDIVITTALIPGRPAPVLITEQMVKDMKQGAIIVDLATAAGGNCPLSERGKSVTKHGVTLIGYDNLPSLVSSDASQLYAKNLLNFITPLVDKEKGILNIDKDDEIVKGCMLTDGGKLVHPMFIGDKPKTEEKAKPAAEKAPPKKMMDEKPHLKKKTATKRAANRPGKKGE